MEVNENPIIQPPPPGRKVRELSNNDREKIIARLLPRFSNGKLSWGSIKFIAEEFHVYCDTVSSIWNRFRKATKNNVNDDVSIINSIHSYKGSRGRSAKYDTVALAEALAEQPFESRQTLRSASASLSISTTTLLKAIKSGEVKMNSISVRYCVQKHVNQQSIASNCGEMSSNDEALDNQNSAG